MVSNVEHAISDLLEKHDNCDSSTLKRSYETLLSAIENKPRRMLTSLQPNLSALIENAAHHLKDAYVAECIAKLMSVLLPMIDYDKNFSLGAVEKILDALFDLEMSRTANLARYCVRCLSLQKLPFLVVKRIIRKILFFIERVVEDHGFSSPRMCVDVLDFLLHIRDKCWHDLSEENRLWIPSLLKLLINNSTEVRQKALQFFDVVLSTNLNKDADFSYLKPLVKTIIYGLKDIFGKKNGIYALRCWSNIVKLTGKLLRSDSVLLNSTLPLIEKAFKFDDVDIKATAFDCWKTFIAVFAEDIDVLTKEKRLKLILQPLIFVNRCNDSENVALEKVRVWILLINSLGFENSARLFDQVCLPFLRFCVGGECEVFEAVKLTPQSKCFPKSPVTPQTPKLYLKSVEKSSGFGDKSLACFPCVQKLLGKILLAFLSKEEDAVFEEADSRLKFKCRAFGSEAKVFEKHCGLFIQCLRIYAALSNSNGKLVNKLWTIICQCIKDTEAVLLSKSAFQCLLECYILQLNSFLDECHLDETLVYDLVDDILDSLCFRFIRISLLRDTFETDLSSLVILSPSLKLLRENPEKMLQLTTKTISTLCGHSKMKYLNNAEEILKFLISTNNSKWTKAILAPMWDILTNCMFTTLHIKDEIDQGDAINHNFSCVNNLLLFPFVHFIDNFADAKFLKNFVPQWKKIFCECLRCAGLTTSTSANSLIEELCALFVKIPGIHSNTPAILYALSEIVKIMLENQRLDVSFNKQQFLALSPVKMNHLAKKSPVNPAVNEKVVILSSTNLLVILLNLFSEDIRFLDFENSDKISDMILQNILTCLEIKFKFIRLEMDIRVTVEKLTVSFTNVLVELKSRNKKFVEKRSSGYSKLFNCMKQMLDSVTSQPEIFQFDTELLQAFEVFLNHLLSIDDPKLRQITLKFWNNTFGKCHNLIYPENLKLALLKLKKREVISLPGISSVSAGKSNLSSFFHQNSDSPCIIEDILPLSAVQVRSHIPATEIKRTTFFYDDERIDEKVSKSESKIEKNDVKDRTKSKKVTRKRKRLILEDSQSDDYVRIAPQQTKKKIVLTDHQKEKLLEKKEMPFLNNKENSRSNSKMNITAMFATDSQLIDSEILNARGDVGRSSEKLQKSDAQCELVDGNGQLLSTAVIKDAVVIVQKLQASEIESMLNYAERDENQIFPRRLQKAKRTGLPRSKSCSNVVLSSQNSVEDEPISSQPAHLSSRAIKSRKFVTKLTTLKECNSLADVQEKSIIAAPKEDRALIVENENHVENYENDHNGAVTLIQPVENVESNAKLSKDTVDSTSFPASAQVDHDLLSTETDNAGYAIVPTNEKGNKSSELKFTPENNERVNSNICSQRPSCIQDKNLDVSIASPDDVDHSLVISVSKQNPLTTPVKTPVAWTSADGYRTPQNKILNNDDFSIKRRQNGDDLDDDLMVIGETRQESVGKTITAKNSEPSEITVVKIFSPASTPSATGILKRKLMQVDEDFGASPSKKFDPSASASKKVHFAPDEASLRDDQFGIRPSPRRLRAGSVTPERKPKSLNRKPMLNTPPPSFAHKFSPRTLALVSSVTGSQKISNYFSSLQSSTSLVNDSSMISPKEASSTTILRSQAVYPSLVNDETSVKEILPYLVSGAWRDTLVKYLETKSISSIGHLAQLSELNANYLPIRQPKMKMLRSALEKFEKSRKLNPICTELTPDIMDTDNLTCVNHHDAQEKEESPKPPSPEANHTNRNMDVQADQSELQIPDNIVNHQIIEPIQTGNMASIACEQEQAEIPADNQVVLESASQTENPKFELFDDFSSNIARLNATGPLKMNQLFKLYDNLQGALHTVVSLIKNRTDSADT